MSDLFICLLFLVNLAVLQAKLQIYQGRVFPCRWPTLSLSEVRCENNAGCIAVQHMCDGVLDCPNGSDEAFCPYIKNRQELTSHVLVVDNNNTQSLEFYRSKRQSRGACVLPDYPKYGSYEVLSYPSAKPGENYDSFALKVKCRRGYGLVDADTNMADQGIGQMYCINGDWSHAMPKCTRFCKLNPDPSVRYMCHVPGTGYKVCATYVPPGTSVNPLCNTPVYYSAESLLYMKCIAGAWDYVAQCKAECGRVTPEGAQLIINGTSVKRGELPWHAGVYQKTYRPYMQVCGGSLVSNKVVISAGHCFWNDVSKQLPASDFSVAVGKLYRPWDNDRDVGAQKSDVKEIKIPSLFDGSAANFQEDIAVLILVTPFIYKTYIRPLCLNFDVKFDRWQLQNGKFGKVAGWGLMSANGGPSPTLKVVDIPFVSDDICIKNLPLSFREYITGDKFCAGYTNGTALCKGDSGGGLAFPDTELGVDRYYLRGIVSAAPRQDDLLCNPHTYTTFTKITKHEEFIKQSIAATADKVCTVFQFECDDGSCVDYEADCNIIQSSTISTVDTRIQEDTSATPKPIPKPTKRPPAQVTPSPVLDDAVSPDKVPCSAAAVVQCCHKTTSKEVQQCFSNDPCKISEETKNCSQETVIQAIRLFQAAYRS